MIGLVWSYQNKNFIFGFEKINVELVFLFSTLYRSCFVDVFLLNPNAQLSMSSFQTDNLFIRLKMLLIFLDCHQKMKKLSPVIFNCSHKNVLVA